MAWRKAPPTSGYFWLSHFGGWGAFVLINFITRQYAQLESLHQGLISMLILLLVNTLVCLLLRELIHRYQLCDLKTRHVWWKLLLLVLIAGFVSAVLTTLGLGLYYLVFGFTRSLVFFMLTVYMNWLITALVIGIWTVVYVVSVHVKTLNQLRLEQQQTALRLKEAELNHLIGQLNPHFLFNGLNNIRGLMLEDVQRARDMLTELADLLRYSLNTQKQQLTALANEIEVVRSYVSLAKIQYEERMQYLEQIDPQTLTCRVPPMLVQLLVENAIRHGIDRCDFEAALRLTITKANEQLRIVVSNPGVLQPQDNHNQTGLGLANINKRLQLLYAEQASFSIQQLGDEVVAEVSLPWVSQANEQEVM